MTTLIVLGIIALAGVGWLVDRQQQPQRDAAAAQDWLALRRDADAHHLTVLYIHDVYEHDRRGSKAYVSFYNGDTMAERRDAWFWWPWVQNGSVVAVSIINEGWGPHSNRPDVLYIGDPHIGQTGIDARIDTRTFNRARRHLSKSPAAVHSVPTRGWYPDPSHRFPYRWWDGQTWTHHVYSHDQTCIDPLPWPTRGTT